VRYTAQKSKLLLSVVDTSIRCEVLTSLVDQTNPQLKVRSTLFNLFVDRALPLLASTVIAYVKAYDTKKL
jgi:hypothetical protein